MIFFYNYYGDYDDDREIAIPQKFSEKFEYEAWFRPYHFGQDYITFDESCKDSNRSSIIMKKISDTSFSYTLTVAGKEIIDVNMSNYSSDFGAADVGVPDADIRNQYWWIPDSFYEIDGGDDISLYYKDGKISVRRPMENTFYSFEGISLRDINETKMTVSFNLLDAGQSDFADYFEFKLDNITKDLLERNDNCLINYGTVTFYKVKDGKLKTVRTYDPNKIEFIFGPFVYEY